MVIELFNHEIPSAIFSANLLEIDPDGAYVPPESGLVEGYLFRLTLNHNKRVRELPALINEAVRCLLTKDEKIIPSMKDCYTRALCRAVAAHLYRRVPRYLRHFPTIDDCAAPSRTLESTSIDVLAAAAHFGCD